MPHNSPRPSSASVNPADVDRFNRLGDLWWDTKGPWGFCTRSTRSASNMSAISRCATCIATVSAQPLEGLGLADIGCSGGILAESLAELGADVTGVDPAPNNIEVAKRHAKKSGLEIDYRNVTAEALAETGATFDIVTALEVIEHVEGQKAFVATLSRLVKPGGLLFLATIDRTLKSYALAIVGAEYVLGWVPRGTHDHDKFVRPDELAGWLRHAGMREIDRAGMTFPPAHAKLAQKPRHRRKLSDGRQEGQVNDGSAIVRLTFER